MILLSGLIAWRNQGIIEQEVKVPYWDNRKWHGRIYNWQSIP
jgi:hypothetical protein